MHVTVNQNRITVVSASIGMVDGSQKRTKFDFFPASGRLLVEDRSMQRPASPNERIVFRSAASWAHEEALTRLHRNETVDARVSEARLREAVGLIESHLA